MAKARSSFVLRVIVIMAVAGIAWGVRTFVAPPGTAPPTNAPAPPSGTVKTPVPTESQFAGVDRLIEAFRDGASNLLVEVPGTVDRVLADDDEGSRHQRFIVRLTGGHTVLVAHNIDLAARVPLKKGDAVRVRGEYEWNDRGGVVHWTHHDPAGRHPGGWIEHEGERFE